MAQWLEVADFEVSTRERYEDLDRLYIQPRLGDMQAGRLDAELLERLYARLHRCRDLCNGRPSKTHTCRPLSSSTTRKITTSFGALDRAVRWRYLSVNPAQLVEAPTPRKLLWLTTMTGSHQTTVP